ncbi:MAG TPA: TonB family protein [Pyrinomonadaceae bacterium]|nr:TonB family protein [Pyrinomonadaceae bacterium]
MFTRISAPALVAVAFLAAGTCTAQSNLSAKANTFQPQPVSAVETDRIKDGLVGPVRRVRTEVVKLLSSDGRIVEGKRALLELVAYDLKGNKVENQYFPVAGATLTGKETYKYDDKGNISEMVLFNADGSLMSKEIYKYEFDFAGNWNKMITSVAVIDSGKLSFEPTEITYRSIMYYLDENMVKMATTPAAPAGTQPNSVPASDPANSVARNLDPKPQPPVELPISKQPTAHKTAAQAVPTASMSGDRLNAGNPVEVKNVASNSAAAPSVVLEAEPPPSPAPRPILRPVSGGVLNGSAVYLPSPAYPDTAKRMRTTGVVAVEVVIDESGKVISATAENGPSTLREAAVRAALRARFSPTKLSGQPVKVFGTISYKFSLSQ